MSAREVLESLRVAVKEYDSEAAASCAKRAVSEKINPVEAANAITSAIKEIGDAFGRGELWLPDLVGAAAAMQSAMSIIEAEIVRQGAAKKSLGTVVLGTVHGDIHDIGKTMVSTMLTAGGFTVYDIGVNVIVEEFLRAVKEHKPDILAMSALLTTTAAEQRKIIQALRQNGMRDKVKIMVGGGAITEEFARAIGADGYDATALGAVGLAKRLIGIE